jgi:plasmid stabilization system protein ParE
MGLTFHRLIQRDLNHVLGYYEEEGGPELSRRFYEEFEAILRRIEQSPRRFHLVSDVLRRANFPTFPYHLLFREIDNEIRILVLRHHRRRPDYGLARE